MHILNAFLRFTRLSVQRTRSCCKDDGATHNSPRERGNGRGESAFLLSPASSSDLQSTETRTRSLTGHYESFSHSWSAVQLFFFHACVYYLFAVLGYSFMAEDWSIIDSLYVATVVFLTIGYGDIHPMTNPGKLFTICLATYGIIILGIFIGIMGESIVDRHIKERRVKSRRTSVQIIDKLEGRFRQSTAPLSGKEEGRQHRIQHQPDALITDEGQSSLLRSVIRITALELPVVSIVAVMAMAVGYYEGWSMLDSIYWLSISGYTIGFGDFTPKTDIMKLFCCLFLPFCVAVLGEILARIASLYMDRKRHTMEHEFLNRTMTLSDLRTLDLDDDGVVDRAEFLCYMLIALQKVDREDIDDILQAFYRLDRDGSGSLSENDLHCVSRNLRQSCRDLRRSLGRIAEEKQANTAEYDSNDE